MAHTVIPRVSISARYRNRIPISIPFLVKPRQLATCLGSVAPHSRRIVQSTIMIAVKVHFPGCSGAVVFGEFIT
jgi:hypothetical protein